MRPRNVAPRVERFDARTPTLPPATHTNSYALGDREVVLVEPSTPYEDEQREWLAWARALASNGRELRAIVLTHHHLDHVGGAELFARELGLPVWAHRATAERVGVKIDRALDEGELLALDGPTRSTWRVMHTPGHAPGHVCLHDEEAGTVIVGDMVASVGTILIEPNDGDMSEYLAQLARLSRLEAHVALPAHGEPIDAPSALFDRYVAHRLAREARVIEALGRAPARGSRAEDLVPHAYADTPPGIWPIARMSLEAHLVKLEREGRAKRSDDGWTLA